MPTKVVPTEIIIFHLAVAGVLLSSIFARLDFISFMYNWLVVVSSIAFYWLIKEHLRDTGRLRQMWFNQVRDTAKRRISVGFFIVLADTAHILLFFIAIFFIMVNIVYILESNVANVQWTSMLAMCLKAANMNQFASLEPQTALGRLICVGISLLSLIFTAVWISIFMKSFEIVFRYE